MHSTIADLRYAFRSLWRDRRLAVAAVGTLSLGIGATAAVLSVAYNVLRRPLPFAEPERLVRMYEEHPGAPKPPGEPELSSTTLYPWRDRTTTLEGLAAYYAHEFTTVTAGEAVRVRGADISAAAFGLLRARPLLGQFFSPADEVPKPRPVVVISARYWRVHWGASRDIVGRSFVIDGEPRQIVAVAEDSFAFPDRDCDLWVPWNDPTLADPSVQGGMWLSVTFGRLKPGATVQQAAAEGTAIARGVPRPAVANLLFGIGGPVEVRVDTFARQLTSSVRPALVVLALGAALVLLIASANAAALLLARGLARRRELAIRTAIGATRSRLARHLLTETIVLAGISGAVGIALASALVGGAAAVAPASIPRLETVRIDLSIVAVSAMASIVAALVAGAVPALVAVRSDLLREAGAVHVRGGNGLLVVQCALASLLLAGAGLTARSFLKLSAVDPGYTAQNVLISRVYPNPGSSEARARSLVDSVLASVRADSRVTAAGAGNMMPFTDATYITGFSLPPSLAPGKASRARAALYVVTPGYAEALGLRLRDGRFLRQNDTGNGVLRAVVSAEFAQQYLPAGRVAGLSFAGGPFNASRTEIVGVVDDVLKDGNGERAMPALYALDQPGRPVRDEVDIVVRTVASPADLVQVVRGAVRRFDPDAAVGESGPLVSRVRASLAEPRFASVAAALVAALGLVLACAGLYSVLTCTVSERRHELGVRAALGATRRDLMRIVLGRGMLVTTCGVALGFGCAAALSSVVSHVLFGISGLDPLAYATAAALLLGSASVACLGPALAASTADPAVVLRE